MRPKFRRRRRRQRDLRTLHELLAEDLLVGFLSVHSFNALVLWKRGDLFLCVCALCTALCGWRAQTFSQLKVNSGASDSYFLNHFLHSFIVEGILLDCVGDKLESGSEYRFVRLEDILNSHLKISSSISFPRRSSHHDDDD